MDVYKILVLFYSTLVLTVYAMPDYCYQCTNNPDEYSYSTYDSTCGDRDYSGNYTYATTPTYDRCATIISANGYISRDGFSASAGIEDGGCYHVSPNDGEKVMCICTSVNLCNTGTYCEQCDFPFSTLHTTTATTKATTTTTTATTTTTSEVSTTSSSEELSCYTCYDCPDVDESTQVVQDPKITSCLTTILILNEATIIRGESFDDVIDGDCHQHGESLTCWCKSSLCNGQAMVELENFQGAATNKSG
ncbi:unnamed protein product [Meganyctiphanes norvegica]|uniref:Sodefrin-like factor n=1 Tax=Meganyctiphanes norvegica TaxID=48144 RepID=A0AAV2R5M6_MEGNR